MGKIGGKRVGAGRKKGRSKKTLERQVVLDALRQRVMKNVDGLLNAQISKAKGQSFVYRIDDIEEGKHKRKENVLVTDEEEIKLALDSIENGNNGDDGYYYITSKEPDNQALDSLFNRTFGRPTESIELTGKGGEPLKPTVFFIPNPNTDAGE